MSSTKPCRDCGIEKPLDEFHRANRNKDGHFTFCKVCASAKAKIRRATNHDHVLALEAATRRERGDALKAYQQAYRESNRESIRNTIRARRTPERRARSMERSRAHYYAHKDTALTMGRQRVVNLHESYVAMLLCMKAGELTPELLAMKREQLSIRRLARQLRKAMSNEGSTDTR